MTHVTQILRANSPVSHTASRYLCYDRHCDFSYIVTRNINNGCGPFNGVPTATFQLLICSFFNQMKQLVSEHSYTKTSLALQHWSGTKCKCSQKALQSDQPDHIRFGLFFLVINLPLCLRKDTWHWGQHYPSSESCETIKEAGDVVRVCIIKSISLLIRHSHRNFLTCVNLIYRI